MSNRDYVKEFLGVGFQFPVRVDSVTGRMKTSSYEDDITEAIRIILMTRKGERVMRPEFGCKIHEFTFGTTDYTSISRMKTAVMDSLVLWEPRIKDIEVEIEMSKEENAELLIYINYTVRATNNPYNLVYPFYMNEGFE